MVGVQANLFDARSNADQWLECHFYHLEVSHLNELFRSLALLILINNSHVKNSKRRTSDLQGLRVFEGVSGTLVPLRGPKINVERPGVRY
ncbi:hypothetical protein D3C76_1499710 [compost metagenome]